jgi:nanoRNase/pAp phosphatase (c-di-AMP/oligoRNAs hydrolase)
LAQIADFLLPTEGVDTVIALGARRGKVILSVRSNRDGLHVGKTLSSNFPDGLAGGHKTLGGGQIPFEFIIGKSTDEDTDLEQSVIESTVTMMSGLFDV